MFQLDSLVRAVDMDFMPSALLLYLQIFEKMISDLLNFQVNEMIFWIQ